MVPSWVRDYVGIPFLPKGRDHSGCDCWGLVRLVLAERYDTQIPSFVELYEDDDIERPRIAQIINENRPLVPATRLVDPEPGSVALFAFRTDPYHVGLYVGDGQLLHTSSYTGTILERADSPRFLRRLEGWYRVC